MRASILALIVGDKETVETDGIDGITRYQERRGRKEQRNGKHAESLERTPLPRRACVAANVRGSADSAKLVGPREPVWNKAPRKSESCDRICRYYDCPKALHDTKVP